jgi:hypothetical protein
MKGIVRGMVLIVLGAMAALALNSHDSLAGEQLKLERGGKEGPVLKGTVPVAADSSEDRPMRKRDPGTLEVRFIDDSVLHLKIRDPKLELVTPYGTLMIPVTDIEKIEVGMRIPDEVARRIEAAAAGLGSPNFRTREAASAELLALGEKAIPALQRAVKHSDREVAHRAEEILEKLAETLPEDRMSVRETDVVHTKDSAIAGKIAAAALRVSTAQFGEQQLKLADVVVMRSPNLEESKPGPKNVLADPGSLGAFQAQVGATLAFRVTGGVGGSIWGTDFYTLDTTLATACVHAGLLKVGQTGIIKVTILGPQGAFQGSTRNGVTSSAYGGYPGAYRVHK